MPTSHFYGLIPQTPDPRDLMFQFSPRMAANFPPVLDNGPHMGTQLDQARLGSCGANTADESYMYDQLAQSLPMQSMSRLFMYWTTRYLQGTVDSDSGVENRKMMKALNQFGACPESMHPYADDQFTFRKKPTDACFTAALANRITSYTAVQVSLNQIKSALFSGFTIIFGFLVFRGIESDQASETGIVPDPASGEQPIGGHDVSLCGFSDVTGMFKFRNHWMNGPGRPWGDNGYGYASYKYFTDPNLVSDLWVINAVPGSAPVPVPPIPPTPPVPPIPPIPPSPPIPTPGAIQLNIPSAGAWELRKL